MNFVTINLLAIVFSQKYKFLDQKKYLAGQYSAK